MDILGELKIEAGIAKKVQVNEKEQAEYCNAERRGELPDNVVKYDGIYYNLIEQPKEKAEEYLKIRKVALLSKIEKHLKTIKIIMLICFFSGITAALIWLIVFLLTL